MNKYCDNCEHLTLKEKDQVDKHQPHICNLTGNRLLHQGKHPRIPVPDDCPLLNKEV